MSENVVLWYFNGVCVIRNMNRVCCTNEGEDNIGSWWESQKERDV